MSAFADTSYICALHVPLDHTPKAIQWQGRQRTAILITGLVVYEFRQSVRLQIFRHRNDKTSGFSLRTGDAAVAQFESNLAAGAFTVAPVDWADVLDRAERISAKHTVASGHRSMDVLHAASAQHLGVKQFLSFDLRQRDLATALGFETVP